MERETPPPSTIARRVDELMGAAPVAGRVTVVNHWATWCEPCVAELPYLARIAAEYSSRVAFVGISWERFLNDADAESARAQVDAARAAHGLAFPTILAPPEPDAVFACLRLETPTIPQTHVFDARGARVWSLARALEDADDQAAFEGAIERALAEARP